MEGVVKGPHREAAAGGRDAHPTRPRIKDASEGKKGVLKADEYPKELKTGLAGLVKEGMLEKALELISRVYAAEKPGTPGVGEKKGIEEIIQKTVEKMVSTMALGSTGGAVGAPAGRRSWASVAASPTSGSSGSAAWEPRMVIPARKEREVTIKAASQREEFTRRSPKEVVEAVNKSAGNENAVAARRLRSGDVVVTMQDKAATQSKDETWVQRAFGETATIKRYEVTLIAKGIPVQKVLQAGSDTDVANTLRTQNTKAIAKCKRRMPKNTHGAYAALLLHIGDAKCAETLCTDGLLWDAQIFNVEPYDPELRVCQCFGCYRFGHIARYCENRTRCGCCAGVAHKEGEKTCPEAGPEGKKRSVNCGGTHTAWDRRCPVAQAQKNRVKEAYQHRPRHLDIRSDGGSAGTQGTYSTPEPSVSQPIFGQTRLDGFTTVES